MINFTTAARAFGNRATYFLVAFDRFFITFPSHIFLTAACEKSVILGDRRQAISRKFSDGVPVPSTTLLIARFYMLHRFLSGSNIL